MDKKITDVSGKEADLAEPKEVLHFDKSLLQVSVHNKMFNPRRDFNIITGEVASKHTSKRAIASSMQLERFIKKEEPPKGRVKKLGSFKDKAQFQYSYGGLDSKPREINRSESVKESVQVKRENTPLSKHTSS